MSYAVIDFETKAIEPWPDFPPKPVGVAVLVRGRSAYYAWGHPDGNNCTRQEAQRLLRRLWKEHELVFHNAKFDLAVAERWLDLPLPDWQRVHDTMFMAFLIDPHSVNLSLKNLAEHYLGKVHEGKSTLERWLRTNVPAVKRAPSTWGAHISKAPAGVVEPYARDDVEDTWGLFKRWRDEVRRELGEAYDRERRLLPLLLRMERRGVPVSLWKLRRDVPLVEQQLADIENKIRRRLGCAGDDELKFAGNSLADALEAAGKIDAWVLTAKGNRSTSADNLRVACNDPDLVALLDLRGMVATCLTTFMRPWLDQAERTGGTIHCTWNQCRQYGAKANIGARTGRLSSSPNFMNIIRSDKVAGVPHLRGYIVPGRGQALVGRDYMQQELRILAHYELGRFYEGYQEDPRRDGHDTIRELVLRHFGIEASRKEIKNVNFGLIYGMGIPALAKALEKDPHEARAIKKAVLAAVPGLKGLLDDLRQIAKNGEAIYTWGGRRYYVEPPKVINGRLREFDYKLINQLVQGSAADCTKQAMVNYYEHGYDDVWPLLLQVHDELLARARIEDVAEAHHYLRESMEGVNFDIPMLTDGEVSRRSWDHMRKFNDA